jgi:hypothetical protein
MAAPRSGLLLIRAGIGAFFCLVALALFALCALLWVVQSNIAVALPFILAALALFAFGTQLCMRPAQPTRQPVNGDSRMRSTPPHQQPAKERRWEWLSSSAFPLCWGVAGVSVAIQWAWGLRWSVSDFITLRGAGTMLPGLLLMFPVVLELQVLAHEAGHFAAAWLIGLRPISLRSGLVHWFRTPHGYRLTLNREPGYGLHGQVQVLLDHTQVSPAAFAFFLLAGVLVNAAMGLASIAWLMSLETSKHLGALALGCMMAGFSMESFFANLIPFRSTTLGRESDGSQLLSLLRSVSSRRAVQHPLTGKTRGRG